MKAHEEKDYRSKLPHLTGATDSPAIAEIASENKQSETLHKSD